ncbi:MAG: hypothetical protein FWF36_09875 [Propionibacteriaceae bacterium]|nr:hypothetical protein [Propionibacteriaceae bacterium]
MSLNVTSSNLATSATLTSALIWRARKEGFGSIFVTPAVLAVLFGVITVTASLASGPGSSASAGQSVLGVPITSTGQMAGLMLLPMIFLVGLGMGGGLCAQALLGSEITSGSFELWLSRLGPRAIATGLFKAAVAGLLAIWVMLVVIGGAFFGILATLPSGPLPVNLPYVLFCLLLPLLLGLAGVAASIGITLMNPKLASANARGIAHGTGAIVTLIAVLPQLIAVLVVVILGRTGTSLIVIGGIGVAIAVIAAAVAIVLGAFRLSRDQIVSSL